MAIKNDVVLRLYESDWTGRNNLPSFDKVGGVPLIYVSTISEITCGECANKLVDDELEDVDEVIPHYEGSAVECDECGEMIESAYGSPDEVGGYV